MRRLLVAIVLLAGAASGGAGCGPEAQGKSKRVPIGLESPDETPGDAVTASPSAPTSPGFSGPSRPGGPGGGGGSMPQRR